VSVGSSSMQETPLGRRIAEFVPLPTKNKQATISRVSVLRNADDEVVLEAFFASKGAPDLSAVFAFGKTEIVEIKPSDSMKGISLLSSIEYGIVPSFVGDDLIFAPTEYTSENALCVTSENLFLGLLSGENHELVVTWPKARQQMKLL